VNIKGKDGLQVIKDNTDFILGLPWNGEIGLFTIHMLNATQLRACGDFTTLSLNDDEEKEEMTLDSLIDIKNMQERLMQSSMVKPTYDEVLEWPQTTSIYKSMQELVEKTRALNKKTKDIEEARMYEKEINSIEIRMSFLFPDDFMSTLTAILLQKNCTDISKVTKQMLFEWACMAERGDDNPADHASGIFTEFQREDINKYAWLELAHFRELEDVKKSSKKNWVRGHKKR